MLHQRSLAVALTAGVVLAVLTVLMSAWLLASPLPLGLAASWGLPAAWQAHPAVQFALADLLWCRLPVLLLACLFGLVLVKNLQGPPSHLLLACALPWLAYVPMSLLGPHLHMPWLRLLGVAGWALLPVLLGLWLAGRSATRAPAPLSFRRPQVGMRRSA
ncbi:hypothetical protein [Roseateles toxinivorans]|uniref:Uncharacterized protein n=1 Tax=Roseateles toxinivorans TaxID=270368 RepID=A0A4R6QNQ0_9BURK|nr:hypothetical protein [Roseateles toxinivorans]TDP72460.1 hypothetical protein DES47_102205 [Roseateles toxinivorans]